MMQRLCVLVFALHVSVAHAVDCYANPGQPLASCDRWIACAASNGTQCDNGSGALGTQLYAMSREHVCLHINMRNTTPPPLTRAPPPPLDPFDAHDAEFSMTNSLPVPSLVKISRG